jgi:two-component system response regulator YesN
MERMAEDLNFENSHLRRTFKRKTGKTISKRLEDIRIARAKAMLRSGQLTASEVAERAGFSNQHYFSTRFKLLSGCTPSEYRSESGTGRPDKTKE